MSFALTRTHHPPLLGELNAYGVQELTASEATATNGGAIPLFVAIATIVGADAAILAGGVALLNFLAQRADKE